MNKDSFEKNILNYIENNFLYDYIAYYIFNIIKLNLLSKTDSYESIIFSALDLFNANFKVNKNKLESILENKYNLKIINYNPLQIKKS